MAVWDKAYNDQYQTSLSKDFDIPYPVPRKVKQMASVLEEAKAYEPKESKNVADLDKFFLGLEIVTQSFLNNKGEEVEIKVVEIDGEHYRVPNSVLKHIKVLLKDNPNLQYVKVLKDGEGLKTSYTVTPVE